MALYSGNMLNDEWDLSTSATPSVFSMSGNKEFDPWEGTTLGSVNAASPAEAAAAIKAGASATGYDDPFAGNTLSGSSSSSSGNTWDKIGKTNEQLNKLGQSSGNQQQLQSQTNVRSDAQPGNAAQILALADALRKKQEALRSAYIGQNSPTNRLAGLLGTS